MSEPVSKNSDIPNPKTSQSNEKHKTNLNMEEVELKKLLRQINDSQIDDEGYFAP